MRERIYFIWQIKYHNKSSQVLCNANQIWTSETASAIDDEMEHNIVASVCIQDFCAVHSIRSLHATLDATQSYENLFTKIKERVSFDFVYTLPSEYVQTSYSNNNILEFLSIFFFGIAKCQRKILVHFMFLFHLLVIIQSIFHMVLSCEIWNFWIYRKSFAFKKTV